ncbi:MAG: phosphoglycerate dehydrogenase [Dehalococcoidales bacterium]|nr:phosphoglycerate dehydrogenase [Dehalococcoidales bacterium]
MNILVSDPLGEEGIAILRNGNHVDVKTGMKPAELIGVIGDYDALVVRSQTQVNADVIRAGKKLQVIGRAGVGVDNIDVAEATKQGIIVVNAPTGNTISAAEHAIALMMALARNIPQANASLKGGAWKRSEFTGVEVRNKTLGVIGMGNVGSEVARRARGLDMKVIAYDPYVSADYARNMQIESVSLERIYKESDFITLHIPLTDSTKGLIGAKEIGMMKPNVRIINAARGGLIDEEALVQAIKEKRVAGAAIDVFVTEPTTKSILFEENNIIVTPHLGASTAEAQTLVAKDVAEQIVSVLKGEPARYAVNAPFISSEAFSVLGPFIKAAAVTGRLVRQLSEGQKSSLRIKYQGELADIDTNILKATVIGSLLEGVSEERVNVVNANLVAARRGLSIVEEKESTCENYSGLITVTASDKQGATTAAATVLRGEPHIVRVGDYWVDIVPTGSYFLFSDHEDRPGMIGAVGKITGDANINISSMILGRLKARGQALMVLALDEPLSEKHRQQVLALPGVQTAKIVKL